MKISNFSKLMLIAAMALVGNAAYKMLQNRTNSSSSCCGAISASECATGQTSGGENTMCEQNTATEQAPIAQIAPQEVAPLQTAMGHPHEDMDDGDVEMPMKERTPDGFAEGDIEEGDGDNEDPDDIP